MAVVQKNLEFQTFFEKNVLYSEHYFSNEGSVETMSIAISEMTEGLHQLELNQHQIMHTMPSPDHLVNRKDLLERMGINPGTTSSQKSRSQSATR